MINCETFELTGSDNVKFLVDRFSTSSEANKIIIFCHGFKGFKDWGGFNYVADFFRNKNIIFYKFNFSHNGTSLKNPNEICDLEKFSQNNFTKELYDLNQLINYVEVKDDLSNKELVLIGHSRGGGISIIKSSMDSRVNKLVTWCSPSNFFNKLDSEKIKLWEERKVIYIENKRTNQKLPLDYQFYLDCINNKNNYDILNCCNNIIIPHLVQHAKNDETVEYSEAVKISKNSKESKLISYNSNHVFGMSHPFNESNCTKVLDNVLFDISSFLKT